MEHADADRLTDQLWVGGDLETTDDTLAGRQLAELVAAGVTQIVDVRAEWDDAEWVAGQEPDLDYVWLGVDDAGEPMADSWFEEGTSRVLAHLQDGGGATYVHCHMGVNRGPSMALAVMLRLGWDPVEALEVIHRERPVAMVAYAEDAVDWWLRRQDAGPAARADARQQLADWRLAHDLELDGVLRLTRGQAGAED